MKLNQEQVLRYSRHLIMPEVGVEGQEKLVAAKVLLIGAGGLGSPNALYLAAAGVGTLGIVDFDTVDHTNLHRQVIHGTGDVGKLKVESARETIHDLNPNVVVKPYTVPLTRETALDIMKNYDVIIDGTDNFQTRYLTNDACVFLKKPNVYASIFRFDGQATVFQPGNPESPCYRCLYPEPPPPGEVPSCAEGGVLGILPGLVGLIQATEAIKLILGRGRSLVGRLLLFNALEMTFDELKIRRNPRCPVCGDAPTIKELIDYDQFCGVGRANEKSPEATMSDITVKELKARLDRKDKFTLVDVREPNEFEIARIPGARLLPLSELQNRAHELDTADDIVVHCKSGVRSLKAIAALKQMGFKKLTNVKGGILAWSDEIDSAVPKY
ncbi:MAG: molybdopterin-synthase adenylyltransferase MoeB [Elusimicrobia bacterium]|nr:molybdopterin-synthase adenylyltransferase MoeB [Elusimicrobiota bacterium]MBK7208375.1 molybdopterin-synthase adenylyltransferase MoeB [Elusimicrobiota bacterium]MBK7545135.1 molybdopterin-synthase adenylyltransferase MoeB [Elusimicrobiota bacterium]MBK7688771.1 molybdopterin-synthase adenylyltransferase MoeB [Elusimicrobiota bacterium]MBK8126801.1 molybdopterin-synthase adenylyltransferase MoeB [Elusimicrobiota bacterium]